MHRKHARTDPRRTLTWLCSVMLLAAFPASAAEKERFRLEHLLRIDRVAEAQIAPDGSRVAVVTERSTPEKSYSTRQTLWLVPRDSGPPERVAAQQADASLGNPLWSPDGRHLLYRVTHGESSGLAVLDLADGRSRTVQPCADGETTGTTAWAPDSERIAAICTGSGAQDAGAETERREHASQPDTSGAAGADGAEPGRTGTGNAARSARWSAKHCWDSAQSILRAGAELALHRVDQRQDRHGKVAACLRDAVAPRWATNFAFSVRGCASLPAL